MIPKLSEVMYNLFQEKVLLGEDGQYNADIVPEAIITVAVIVLVSVFSVMIISVLVNRKRELNAALIEAEKAKYLRQLPKRLTLTIPILPDIPDALQNIPECLRNNWSIRIRSWRRSITDRTGNGFSV